MNAATPTAVSLGADVGDIAFFRPCEEQRFRALREHRRVADQARREIEVQILRQRRQVIVRVFVIFQPFSIILRRRSSILVQIERRRQLKRVRARLRIDPATFCFGSHFIVFDAVRRRRFADRDRARHRDRARRPSARDGGTVDFAGVRARLRFDGDHDLDLIVVREDPRVFTRERRLRAVPTLRLPTPWPLPALASASIPVAISPGGSVSTILSESPCRRSRLRHRDRPPSR